MTTYQINILNPKADKLLHDLADLQLISIVGSSDPSLPTPEPAKNKRLTELLLTGPVLTDEQLNAIEETRTEINRWRKKPY